MKSETLFLSVCIAVPRLEFDGIFDVRFGVVLDVVYISGLVAHVSRWMSVSIG